MNLKKSILLMVDKLCYIDRNIRRIRGSFGKNWFSEPIFWDLHCGSLVPYTLPTAPHVGLNLYLIFLFREYYKKLGFQNSEKTRRETYMLQRALKIFSDESVLVEICNSKFWASSSYSDVINIH